MEELLKKLEENLELKNYSRETIKGYLSHIKKYLEFAKATKADTETAKEFVLLELKRKEPASVGHMIFALKYFFREILNRELNIPNPKGNKKLPEIQPKMK